MTSFSRLGLWALCLGVVAVGCSPPAPPQPATITVEIDKPEVTADGVSSAVVTVTHTADVRLTVGQGKFQESGTGSLTIAGGSGTATLVTCDSRTVTPCGGNVRVGAVSASDGASGSASILFKALENCSNGADDNANGQIDCAEASCAGLTCKLPTGSVGTGACSGGACLCNVTGGTPEASEVTCDDGLDNDCDSKVDCADSTCANRACQLAPGRNGTCSGTTCACPGATSENTDTLCSNNVDDDCDGLSDCNDPGCQGVGTTLGKRCDSNSHTCSAAVGGVSSCSVCPGAQAAESTCNDGTDNDCDGTADCADPDCSLDGGYTCNTNGRICLGVDAGCGCSGNGGPAEAAEATCADGHDNDCDGLTDCADTNCRPDAGTPGQSCAPFGFRCTGAGTCVCSGNDGGFQAAETNCTDRADNDCDGLTDCGEAYCQPVGSNPGRICDTRGHSPTGVLGELTCSAPLTSPSTCSICTVPGGAIVELTEGQTVGGATPTCGDGKDNDCSGAYDCSDTSCIGKACDNLGRACNSTGQCLCTTSGAPEADCADNLDNDCDGAKDCADPDCKPAGINPGKVCGPNGRICTTGGACACTGNGGVVEAAEVTCSDGKDNDCDGLSDCADGQGASHCQPVGNALGRICDASGNTCSIPGAIPSACTICSGNGGTREQGSEVTCGDSRDNDCDGITDCIDSDCNGRFCTANGSTCSGSACSCPGGSVETNCGDNLDNDCDGQRDCLDTDCRGSPGLSCGLGGRFCNATGGCVCSGNGGTAEATEGTCGDGFDNDCDGTIDCVDLNCRATPPTFTNGKSCANPSAAPPRIGNVCDGVGACICPGGQSSESLCGDGLDNDCDGLIDCLDPDCAGLSCNSSGRTCPSTPGSCSVCSGNGGAPEANEATCLDGKDNDCDGLVDCADPNCNGLQCNSISVNYTCASSQCRDSTSTYTLVLNAAPTRIPADGTATSAVTATLRNGATAVVGGTVQFSVSAGPGSVNPDAGVTNGAGVTSTTFTSGAAGGPATVQGAYDTGSQIIFGTTTIAQPRMGSILLANQQFTIMGVKFSSFNEINQLTFRVNDEAGQPYPPGLLVSFEHEPKGGSYIGSTPSCTASLCTATAVTNASGQVSVALHSGTVASVVYVKASATAGGIPASITVGNIAIVGAKASGLNVSVICSPRNLPTYTTHDCLKSLYSGTDDRANCTAYFADRFNNVLGRSTITTYSSESGAASAPSFTNPSGQSTGTVLMTGYSLPIDVDAGVAEPSVTWDDGCGPKQHNPRDGLSTIIVSANGEEGFIDGSNGFPSDGVYNAGENFLDLGEPFVDANDNNVRDNNEAYVDSNNNSAWDGPNGVWDAETTIWASTRVNYTGYASATVDTSAQNLLSRWYDLATSPQPPLPTAQPTFVVGVTPMTDGGTTPNATTLGVYFVDQNLNQPSPRATYALSVVQGSAQTRFIVSPATALNDLGMNFTQQYCSNPGGTAGCASACNSAPCYLVTRIDGFVSGRTGIVEIKGTATPSSLIEVRASCTLNSIPTNVSVYGYSQ